MRAHEFSLKFVVSGIFGILSVSSWLQCNALEWSASPSVDASARYDDNINLTTGPHKPVVGYVLAPQATFMAAAELWSLSGRAQVSRFDYPANNVLSHTDHYLDFVYTQKNELSQWGMTANLDKDSTLQSERDQTGLVLTRAQRTSNTVMPSWTRNFTEKDSMTLGYTYTDVNYGDSFGGQLLPYRTTDPSLSLGHLLSERSRLDVTFDYSDYKTKNAPTLGVGRYHSSTGSAQIQYTHALSESVKMSLAAGLRRTDSTVEQATCDPAYILQGCFVIPAPPLHTRTNGSLYAASIEKQFETTSVTGTFSRSLQPTGAGGLVQTDRLTMDYNERLTPRLTGLVTVGIYNTSFDTTLASSSTSRYYAVSPALRWQMSELWTLSGSYTRSVNQSAFGSMAKGNSMYFTLNYKWPKISRSR